MEIWGGAAKSPVFIKGLFVIRALTRFFLFVLPEFILYCLQNIFFDDFEIIDFSLKADKIPPKLTKEQIEAEILRKHLLKCYKLVNKDFKAKPDGKKKKTD